MIKDQLPNKSHFSSEQMVVLLYAELKRLATSKMKHQPPGHTLRPTALINEAFIKLVDQKNSQVWENKAHFLSAASEAMRRILVDRYRHNKRVKRGGRHQRVFADIENFENWSENNNAVDLLLLDKALDQFESEEPAISRQIKMRYFVGLSFDEIANLESVSVRTAHRRGAFAKARLFEIMNDIRANGLDPEAS